MCLGTLGIGDDIHDSDSVVAARVLPLYRWFMGFEYVCSDDFKIVDKDHGTDGSRTSNETARSSADLNMSEKADSSEDAQSVDSVSSVMTLPRRPYRSPHDDKDAMETALKLQSNKQLFKSTLVVRPAFLNDHTPIGQSQLRVGQENDSTPGYTVSRQDLGHWLYHHGIHGSREGTVTISGPLEETWNDI